MLLNLRHWQQATNMDLIPHETSSTQDDPTQLPNNRGQMSLVTSGIIIYGISRDAMRVLP